MAEIWNQHARQRPQLVREHGPGRGPPACQRGQWVDELSKGVQAELLATIQADPSTTPRAVDLLFVAHNLKRNSNRTTNIAERVIFMVKGDIVELNP